MYLVDQRDEAVPLEDVPQSDVGAPLPTVVADEHRVVLGYILSEGIPELDATLVSSDKEVGWSIGLVRFLHPYSHMMGAPNDESLSGHPLADRGLEAYGAFEIKHSSWIRQLERINSVHMYHDRERFLENKRHFVFVFHDSTFECIAHGYEVSLLRSTVLDTTDAIVSLLRGSGR